jgi:hypothetical protein
MQPSYTRLALQETRVTQDRAAVRQHQRASSTAWQLLCASTSVPARQPGMLQVDNDGAQVPITSAADANSSGDEADADAEMAGRQDDDGMEAMDTAGGAAPQACDEGAVSGQPSARAAPVIDEDGFQLVQRGRRRR